MNIPVIPQLPAALYPFTLPTIPQYPHYVITLLRDSTLVVSAVNWNASGVVAQTVYAALGTISGVSVIALLLYLLISAVRGGSGERAVTNRAVRAFLSTDLGILVINLLLADLICSAGWAISLKFALAKKTTASLACSLQASGYMVGIVGVGYWNVAIAFQTWTVLVLQRKMPKWTLPATVAFGWIITLFFVIVGPIYVRATNQAYDWYGPTIVGCFVQLGTPQSAPSYKAAPFFIYSYLLMCAVLYISVAIHVTRIMSLTMEERQPWWKTLWSNTLGITSQRSASSGSTEMSSKVISTSRPNTASSVAAKLLWFPVVYGIVNLPLAIVATMSGWSSDPLATVPFYFEGAFAASFGWCDVLLFIITRRSLILKPNTTSESLDIDTQGPTSRSHRGSIGQHKSRSGAVPLSEFELDRLRWTVQEEEAQEDEEGKAGGQRDALGRNESDWSTVGTLEREEEQGESQVKLV